MTRPREPQSRIISKDSAGKVTVRTADVEGAAALTDPRLQQQLDALRGQRLSQYGISRFDPALTLSFGGEPATMPSRTIQIEEDTIEITPPGQQPRQVPARSELIATTLLDTLGHRLSQIEISNGHLRLTFGNSVQLDVAPHQQWEAWQINSEDDLEIVCVPGGELTIFYPGPSQ